MANAKQTFCLHKTFLYSENVFVFPIFHRCCFFIYLALCRITISLSASEAEAA